MAGPWASGRRDGLRCRAAYGIIEGAWPAGEAIAGGADPGLCLKETFVDLVSALNIVQIIISVVLIIVVLLQAKGSGFSGVFGGDSSAIYRTRRGFERTLFQFTIGLAVAFVLMSLISSIAGRA